MTHQYMEIKIKELEKQIDALEKEHCEYKPFTIDELEDDDIKKLLRLFQDQNVLGSVIPEQEPCEDCISRQDVINTIHKTIYGFFDVVDDDSEEPINDKDKLLLSVNKGISNAVKALSSVTPQPKMWRWIRVTDKTWHLVWECDKCGWQQRFATNYCPDCGAKMQENAESKIEQVLDYADQDTLMSAT